MGIKTIEEYARETGFGSGLDKTKFDASGQMKAENSATMWDDISSSVLGLRLYSAAGSVGYDYLENTIVFSPGGSINNVNDRIVLNLQIPHAAKVDSELRLHVHWEQPDAAVREFTVQYRLQDNGAAKTTAWTTVTGSSATNSIFPYVSGTLNQITEIVAVDLTGVGISSTVQFRLTRTDSETGDIAATFIDAHYEVDTLGSSEEYIK